MSAPSAPPHFPSLPELGPLCRNLLHKLDWKRVLVLGTNPAWDPATIGEGFEVTLLAEGDALPADLAETIVVSPGQIEFGADPDKALDEFSAALEKAPLGICVGSDRDLSRSSLPPRDPATKRLSFEELWKALDERGATPRWGTHTQTGAAWFERHTSLIVSAREDALGEKVGGWLATGIASFSLSRGIGEDDVHPPRPSRVCICTDEIFGPSSNGGIGTAYTAMAEFLAKAGQKVTVLFQGAITSREPISHWIEYYEKKGIELIHLNLPNVRVLPWEDEYMRRAHEDYLWLRRREEQDGDAGFDVIHFPECNGKAFYTCLAKHQGLAFQSTAICIGTHGNTKWVYEGHGTPFFSKFQLATYFMEMKSGQWCDVLVSPSYFLVHWMEHHGWTLPTRTYAQQNIQPYTARGEDEKRSEPFPQVAEIKELVFFGRLESRKGIVIFCDALDLVGPKLAERGISVTFMGKEVPLLDTMSRPYLDQRSRKWDFDWQIQDGFNQDKAVAYLQGEGRVAIMPSLADNSPYTVLEAIGLGVPFVSSRVGGIVELIDPRDVDQATYSHRDRDRLHLELADRLDRALEEGIRPCRRAVSATDNDDVWIRWHQSLIEHPAYDARPDVQAAPAIRTLLLSSPGDPKWLFDERFEAQEKLSVKPAASAVLIWDEDPDAVAAFKQEEAGIPQAVEVLVDAGKASDFGELRRWLDEAGDDYVLVGESATLPHPDELEVLSRVVARSGADLYSPMRDELYSPRDDLDSPTYDPDAAHEDVPELKLLPPTYYPIGAVPLLPILSHAYGGGQILVRASVLASLLPVPGDRFTINDLPSMIAKAVVNGFSYEVVPDRLYDYRHPIDVWPIEYYTVNGRPPNGGVVDAFANYLPEHLSMYFDFEEDGELRPREDKTTEEYWEIRYAYENEMPKLQREHEEQSEWLQSRVEALDHTSAQLAETQAKLEKQSKLAEERKQQLRDASYEKKLVQKDKEHLEYRLNRRLGDRLKRSFGKGKKDGK